MQKDHLFESFKEFALQADEAKLMFGGNGDTPTGGTGDTCSGPDNNTTDDCDSEGDTVPTGPTPV